MRKLDRKQKHRIYFIAGIILFISFLVNLFLGGEARTSGELVRCLVHYGMCLVCYWFAMKFIITSATL